MSQKYLLPCSCGKFVPIETAQAGSDVVCQCGQSLKVPSMLKIKKLRTVEEALAGELAAIDPAQMSTHENAASPQNVSTEQKASQEKRQKDAQNYLKKAVKDENDLNDSKKTTSRVHSGLFSTGLVLLLASIALTFYMVTQTTPKPQDVLKKRIFYHFGGKASYQDSTPITYGDEVILTIPDDMIDKFNPIDAQRFWIYVKDGPTMSFNFNENYQTVKDYYILRCVGCGILNLFALGLFLSSFFLGQKQTVGVQRGSSWA